MPHIFALGPDDGLGSHNAYPTHQHCIHVAPSFQSLPALVHSLASLRDLLFVQLLLFLHRVRVTGHQSPEQGGRVR